MSCFVDSNIWLYGFIIGQDERKSSVSRRLLHDERENIVVSTQVINEVCVNLIKKASFSEDALRELIASFYYRYPVVVPTRAVQITASELREQYSLSFWDSLILASGLQGGATVLYSEDLHHGLIVEEQMEIINPFQ